MGEKVWYEGGGGKGRQRKEMDKKMIVEKRREAKWRANEEVVVWREGKRSKEL